MTSGYPAINPARKRPASEASIRLTNNIEALTSSPNVASANEPAGSGTQDVAIAVMGASGSGKSTFINLVSASKLNIGRGLQSCTSIVQVAEPFELEGRSVTLIDTPGFDDTNKSDADILQIIAGFLATSYENGKTLAGVIYVHRISDFRMGGISTRNFKMFRRLCGDSTLKNVVIVTNMWSEVSESVGSAREAELASEDLFFKPVLDKGARMLRHSNTLASAHAIIAHVIDNHPLPLQIQRELVDQKLDIGETAAGEELNRELKRQLEKHGEEMRALQEEMQEAIREKDEESKQELEAAERKLEEQIARVQNDNEKLASKYSKENRELEQRIQELNKAAREEADRTNADHVQQIHEQSKAAREEAGWRNTEHTHQMQGQNKAAREEADRRNAQHAQQIYEQSKPPREEADRRNAERIQPMSGQSKAAREEADLSNAQHTQQMHEQSKAVREEAHRRDTQYTQRIQEQSNVAREAHRSNADYTRQIGDRHSRIQASRTEGLRWRNGGHTETPGRFERFGRKLDAYFAYAVER